MNRRDLPTPCYLVSEAALRRNLDILKGVRERTGCRILLAQKAFSMFAVYPLIAESLDGAASSGLFEARLAREHMGKENHTFSPAFKDGEFDEIARLSDHVVFNSLAQYEKFGARAKKAGASCGLRINPGHSTQEHAIYDPCAPGSRLGIPAGDDLPDLPDGVEGLHFHTLCEQDSDALEETLEAVIDKFGPWLGKVRWINFGGGHHITRPGYDIERLERCIRRMQQEYGLAVYLEPGEAVALNAGILITRVLDIVTNGLPIAILDASAACHMPDVIEMPYRPPLQQPGTPFDFLAAPVPAGQPGEKRFTCRLAGPTCLAGDVTGDYSFDAPLAPGDRLEFLDMAIYTMVKNNTFNGMPLPAIALERPDGDCEIVRSFSYDDFKSRLS
jgi:carboxynorspermidine decarboxylase